VWVWHSDRAYPIALHARSRLIMAMLEGQSCYALVAQALPMLFCVGALSLSTG
jgi:hypothetical protein